MGRRTSVLVRLDEVLLDRITRSCPPGGRNDAIVRALAAAFPPPPPRPLPGEVRPGPVVMPRP